MEAEDAQPTFGELFTMLLTVWLSADDVSRLRGGIAGIAHRRCDARLAEEAVGIVEVDEPWRLESQMVCAAA